MCSSDLSSGVPVYINANGQLGTITSSRRFKNDIQSMGRQSDALLRLRAVTFRYKDADEMGAHPLQYGLIAEEVAKVAPDLVQYDKAGKPFTVRYHLLTPMLLNELQKERKQVEALNVAFQTATKTQTSKITQLEEQNKVLKSKLASMERAQTEQSKLLVKLVAYLESQKQKLPTQPAHFTNH